eukprot:9566462-Prorocentrum_lima.AAC.1
MAAAVPPRPARPLHHQPPVPTGRGGAVGQEATAPDAVAEAAGRGPRQPQRQPRLPPRGGR